MTSTFSSTSTHLLNEKFDDIDTFNSWYNLVNNLHPSKLFLKKYTEPDLPEWYYDPKNDTLVPEIINEYNLLYNNIPIEEEYKQLLEYEYNINRTDEDSTDDELYDEDLMSYLQSF